MDMGNCNPAEERSIYSMSGTLHIISLKTFDNAMLLAHFTGGETEAKEVYVTWFNDSRQKAKLEFQRSCALPHRGQHYSQGTEKRKWQNCYGSPSEDIFPNKGNGTLLGVGATACGLE